MFDTITWSRVATTIIQLGGIVFLAYAFRSTWREYVAGRRHKEGGLS